MGQHIDERAVVCHQQQALTVLVQAADRAQHGGHIGHQVHDGAGSRVATGLVQHDIGVLALTHDADGLAVNHDLVKIRVHLVAQPDRVAVDLDFASGNQTLGLAAGADTLVSQYLLNSLFCHEKFTPYQRGHQHPAFLS